MLIGILLSSWLQQQRRHNMCQDTCTRDGIGELHNDRIFNFAEIENPVAVTPSARAAD